MCDLLDVEAARGDVGRDEQIRLARADTIHDGVALPLLHAAVQRLGAVAVGVERLSEGIDLQPRAAEDDRGGRVFHLEDTVERRRFLSAADDVGDLADARHLAGPGLLTRNRDALRLIQVAFRNLQDARWQRRRKERRLARGGRLLEDRVDVFGEAHIEHLVGFVEHEDPYRIQVQRLAADAMTTSAPRSRARICCCIEAPP